MRKLASVQKIIDITPIPNADSIELAKVLGWQCVVKKGEYKVNDLIIYFEVDSFLPIRPEFEFLRNTSYKNSDLLGEGFRLKTQKFRGELSQGLIMPISTFPQIPNDVEEGMEVTGLLNVRKWEMIEQAGSNRTMIGELPDSIPHTDETRIQNNPNILDEFSNIEYYISTKLDGTSCSIGIDQNGFHVTGHTREYKDDGKSTFYNLVKEKGYVDRLAEFYNNRGLETITIQGEYCGSGIQKNPLKLMKPDWFIFTIIVNGKRVGLEDMLTICKELNMPTVPIEEVDNNLPIKYPTVEALLKRAEGNYNSGVRKEGIVIRPTIPIYSNLLHTWLSMKVINNAYLLKNSD